MLSPPAANLKRKSDSDASERTTDSDLQYFHKGLHGLKGPGPGYSIVVLSNLAEPDLADSEAASESPAPGRRPPGGLAGGTARLLVLPWPLAREPQAEDPRGSPGPPDLDDSPAEEPGSRDPPADPG